MPPFVLTCAQPLPDDCVLAALLSALLLPPLDEKIPTHGPSRPVAGAPLTRQDIALTAILVASKAEETYKKIRQILAAAFLVLNPSFAGTDLDVKVSCAALVRLHRG